MVDKRKERKGRAGRPAAVVLRSRCSLILCQPASAATESDTQYVIGPRQGPSKKTNPLLSSYNPRCSRWWERKKFPLSFHPSALL